MYTNPAYQYAEGITGNKSLKGSAAASNGGLLGAIIPSTTGTITVYDSYDTSGAKILDAAVITGGVPIWLNVKLTKGLYIAVAGGGKATIAYI